MPLRRSVRGPGEGGDLYVDVWSQHLSYRMVEKGQGVWDKGEGRVS